MCWSYDMCACVNHKALWCHLNACLVQIVDFTQQSQWVKYRTRADDALHAGMQDSRWDQMQFKGVIAHTNGMSSVVSPGVTRDHIGLCRKPICNPALAFISPLCPNQYRSRQCRLLT